MKKVLITILLLILILCSAQHPSVDPVSNGGVDNPPIYDQQRQDFEITPEQKLRIFGKEYSLTNEIFHEQLVQSVPRSYPFMN